MSNFFTDIIPFNEGSRMTGIWCVNRKEEALERQIATVHLIAIPSDQEVSLEATFLSAFIPLHVGGFFGVDLEARQWIVLVQVGPAFEFTGPAEREGPVYAMTAALARALEHNPQATCLLEFSFSHLALIDAYAQMDLAPQLRTWTTTDLVKGLLAQMSGVSGASVVLGREINCAFPKEIHDCQGDVFLDAFERWSAQNGS